MFISMTTICVSELNVLLVYASWARGLSFPARTQLKGFNLLASTPHFGILGLTVRKRHTKLKIITGADFSVLHTQFYKEAPLGFTIHHPKLIMLKNIKMYRDWSALKKVYNTE